MKEIKKLDRDIAVIKRASDNSSVMIDGFKAEIIDKINELVEAYNELNKHTRKVYFDNENMPNVLEGVESDPTLQIYSKNKKRAK